MYASIFTGDMYKLDEKYLSQQPSLPVDEEDYLMPASCSRGPSVRYMDLIGDTHLPGMHLFCLNFLFIIFNIREWLENLMVVSFQRKRGGRFQGEIPGEK